MFLSSSGCVFNTLRMRCINTTCSITFVRYPRIPVAPVSSSIASCSLNTSVALIGFPVAGHLKVYLVLSRSRSLLGDDARPQSHVLIRHQESPPTSCMPQKGSVFLDCQRLLGWAQAHQARPRAVCGGTIQRSEPDTPAKRYRADYSKRQRRSPAVMFLKISN